MCRDRRKIGYMADVAEVKFASPFISPEAIILFFKMHKENQSACLFAVPDQK